MVYKKEEERKIREKRRRRKGSRKEEERREGRNKEWRDGGENERGGALVISSCITNHSKICSLKQQLFCYLMILWIDWL